MNIDLEQMTANFENNKMKLYRVAKLPSCVRERPVASAAEGPLPVAFNEDAREGGALQKFCRSYNMKYHGYNDSEELPTIREVVMGLCNAFCEIIEEKMKNSRLKGDLLKRIYKAPFEFLIEASELSPDQALTWEELSDPESQALKLCLFLYSIEPPFYAYLNRAMTTNDQSKLSSLGPFAVAMNAILSRGAATGQGESYMSYGLHNGGSLFK